MNEILENLPTYTGIALGTYTALLVGAQAVQDLATEKITSQEQLDGIVEEEAKKLGMDSRLVVGKFYAVGDINYDRIRGARCYQDDFEFEGHTLPFKVVEIKEGWGARRGAVRHELYHLHKHMPLRKNPIAIFLRGFFYEEPTATLYATTGIKL
jgi:hypothetical protein